MTSPRILALWSVPRSRSTAFFRMMIERGDFDTVHEPFSYLAEFGRSEVAGRSAVNEAELIDAIRHRARHVPLFFKDTTDERYPGVLADADFLARDAVHAFLVRDPALTIPSYRRLNPAVTVDQIGFEHLHELYLAVRAATGTEPVVIDAEDLMADPAGLVDAFGTAVGIDSRPHALQWTAGTRAEWSPSARWHVEVEQSGGFGRIGVGRAEPPVDALHERYLTHHRPYYADLYARRLAPATDRVGRREPGTTAGPTRRW